MLESVNPAQGLSEAFTFDRDVTFSLREKIVYTKQPSGWSGHATMAKKLARHEQVFLLRMHVRLHGLAERSGGRHTSTFTQIFNRSHKSVGERLLNIIALCNPQLLKTSDRYLSEELHKTRLCLSKLWASFVGVIFCTSARMQLFAF